MTITFDLQDSRPQAPTHVASFHEWNFPDGTPWTRFYRRAQGYLLRFPRLADFEVSADGRSVSCRPVPGVTESSVHHLYLNQVLPLAQSRHGKLMFHASAVEIDESCVVFMGGSGLGKSTLAASFATNGHPFLTDDGLEVSFNNGMAEAAPSHPSIRLWQDSQDALLAEDASTAAPVQYTSKARFLAQGNIAFCNQKRPIRCICILEQEPIEQPVLTSVSPGLALKELVKHSFLLDFEETDSLATHFEELTKVVRLVPFIRLNYPRQFAKLRQVREAIVAHATWLPHRAIPPN